MQVDYLLKVAKWRLFNCAMKSLHIHNAKLHHCVEYTVKITQIDISRKYDLKYIHLDLFVKVIETQHMFRYFMIRWYFLFKFNIEFLNIYTFLNYYIFLLPKLHILNSCRFKQCIVVSLYTYQQLQVQANNTIGRINNY